MISQSDMRTFVSETEFDTWGRTMRVTYPDGEVVSYSYTQSGLLSGMSGTKSGRTYDLISRQGYDDRGQRVYRRYGNGAEQTLAYDPCAADSQSRACPPADRPVLTTVTLTTRWTTF